MEHNNLLDRKLLEMLVHAAAGEAAAMEFYKNLSEMLVAEDDRKLVRDIALDEAKHRRLFEELFTSLSGERMPPLPQLQDEPTTPTGSFPSIFEDRIKDELRDVEFYRQIYFALVNLDYRDILFEIITDELRHAHFMTYLYAKYR